jgi:hypothetical protein
MPHETASRVAGQIRAHIMNDTQNFVGPKISRKPDVWQRYGADSSLAVN